MTDGFISLIATSAIMLALCGVASIFRRDLVVPKWVLIAIGLVAVRDVLVTNFYGTLPDLLPESDWNWQGKLVAAFATLAIAAHPAFGWQRVGLTLRQNSEGRQLTYSVAVVMLILFSIPAIMGANEPINMDELSFQLTLPGLEEEPFYRGILLFAFNEAFRGRFAALGVRVGWGALLLSALFGLEHAFSFSSGAFSFDVITMLVTSIPALILIWFRERTGSLLIPILLHNFANSIDLVI